MGDKKESIYSSSQEAFWKIMVLVFSFGISIVASLFDDKSCYIAILVQAVNNIYDFYPMTDNRLYAKTVKKRVNGNMGLCFDCNHIFYISFVRYVSMDESHIF